MIRAYTLAIGFFAALVFPSHASANSQCPASPLKVVDKDYGPPQGWNYNRELVTANFGLFAAASYDAYEPAEGRRPRDFSIADDDARLGTRRTGLTGWRIGMDRVSYANGLSFDVYIKESEKALIVLTAFRGTDGWLDVDLLANTSWISQWFNPYDQYRVARKEFQKVVDFAKDRSNGRPVCFIVTGHSLGGGLAQHIAHVFPGVSAVVFNSSFVTNSLLFGTESPLIIKIYEDADPFSRLARLGSRELNSNNIATYRLNGSKRDDYQHSMEALAASMLRTTLDCAKRTDCKVKKAEIQIAYVLYCKRYRERRNLPADSVCSKTAPTENFYTP